MKVPVFRLSFASRDDSRLCPFGVYRERGLAEALGARLFECGVGMVRYVVEEDWADESDPEVVGVGTMRVPGLWPPVRCVH